jgi:predicted nucleic acid-binding protein
VSQQKFLFDTNLFIERFRRTPKVVRLFDELSSEQVTLSVVSYLEFVRGEVLVKRIRAKTVNDAIGHFMIEPLTSEMGLYAGQKALKLKRTDMNDLAIAATALKLKRTLVTFNTKDFTGFAGLRVTTVDELLE